MKNNTHKINEELLNVILFISSIWITFLISRFIALESYGLIPRSNDGLIGILTMPFIHIDFMHLMSNTMPLIILLSLLAGSKANSSFIVVGISLLSSSMLWVFGRGDVAHVGASGLVFGLATFLILSGILERRIIPMIISLLIVVMYGSTLLSGIAPWQEGISWDGHLLGGVAGALMSVGYWRLSK